MAFADIASGSIYPSIIMHFMNNFINVFFSYGQTAGFIKFSLSGFLNTIYSQSAVLFLIFVILVLFLCLFAFANLVKLLHKTSLHTRKKADAVVEEQPQPEQSNQNADVVMVENIMQNPRNKKTIGEWLEENVAPDEKVKLDAPLIEKIPFVLCVFMAILITTFTFIWGVI